MTSWNVLLSAGLLTPVRPHTSHFPIWRTFYLEYSSMLNIIEPRNLVLPTKVSLVVGEVPDCSVLAVAVSECEVIIGDVIWVIQSNAQLRYWITVGRYSGDTIRWCCELNWHHKPSYPLLCRLHKNIKQSTDVQHTKPLRSDYWSFQLLV